jgi:hypothetical protein
MSLNILHIILFLFPLRPSTNLAQYSFIIHDHILNSLLYFNTLIILLSSKRFKPVIFNCGLCWMGWTLLQAISPHIFPSTEQLLFHPQNVLDLVGDTWPRKNLLTFLSFFTQISMQYDILYRSSEPLLKYYIRKSVTLWFSFFISNIVLIIVLHIPSYRQAYSISYSVRHFLRNYKCVTVYALRKMMELWILCVSLP